MGHFNCQVQTYKQYTSMLKKNIIYQLIQKLHMKPTLFHILVLFPLFSLLISPHNLQHQSSPQNLVELAIIGTNDLHGTVFPKQLIRTDTHQQYQYGGLVYAATLIKIIKEQYKGRVLYLDAGDQFQGGIESSPEVSSGEIMSDFFNSVGLDGATLGNHQFDYSMKYLIQYLSRRNSPTIISNIYDDQRNDKLFENQMPTKIYDLQGIKVGVIGLITEETTEGSKGFIDGKFPNYSFLKEEEISNLIVKSSKQLRNQGKADIVLVLSHIGAYCGSDSTFDIRNNQTQQTECQNDELIRILKQVPKGYIDGVVAGHRHQFMHHYYHNIPFMGSINGGYYFNILHIVFNRQTRKVERTSIEGPVPVCGHVFRNTKQCKYYDDEELKSAGSLVRWKFHGIPVKPDQQFERVLDTKWKEKMTNYLSPLFKTQILLERVLDTESILANIITTMMKRGTQRVLQQNIDMVIINQGCFRSTWYPGQVNYKEFLSMFSFADKLMKFTVTGKQLLQIEQIIQRGRRGFYYFYGLKQTLRRAQIYDPAHQSSHLIKQFVNATLMDGTLINEDQEYNIVTWDFLASGGDDFSKVLNGYTDQKSGTVYEPVVLKNLETVGMGRDIILEQLQQMKVINKQSWEINLKSPWMTIISE